MWVQKAVFVLGINPPSGAGSLVNAHWIQNSGVEVGMLCTIQAILKQTSDVGTAIWTLVCSVLDSGISLVLTILGHRRTYLHAPRS